MAKRIANLPPKQRALLFQQLNRKREDGSTTIRPVPRDIGPLPQSFSQQRLWFLDQFTPGQTAYNFPLCLSIQGALEVEVLQQCLDELVRRHEALRTTFAEVDERPAQRISPPTPVALSLMDLRRLPSEQRDSELQRLAGEAVYQPFDLANGPLLRTVLVQLEEAEYVLLLIVHHIIFDGWSASVFLRELAALYKAFAAGQPSPLSELSIQYADYAVWQQEWLSGEVLEAQVRYWREQLAGAPALLELSTDHPRPALQSYRGATYSFSLPPTLVDALKTTFVRREEGVTLFMVLLAAFNVLLYRYSGQEDIVLGSPIAGRNRTELEDIIGCFLNNLVLRTDLSGDPTFQELLQRVRTVVLGAFAHQELPFEKLVDALQPERHLSYSPVFQVMFALLKDPLAVREFAGLAVHQVQPFQARASRYDLVFYLTETEEGLSGLFEYNTDLFDASTIERMSRHFHNLLQALVADPQERVGRLPLLTDEERRQLVVEWNDTQRAYPQTRFVHQWFEEQAQRTPDTVALVYDHTQLTYSQLNQRANQLAHTLQQLGVGPDTLIGICLERSVEMVVGLLAILKAGGAYVPLDPTYPPERLAFMAADAQTPILLTKSDLLATLPVQDATVLCLDREDVYRGQSTENPATYLQLDNLAYVIYTSGSTGKPKGAMNTHAGILNRLLWMQDMYQLDESDSVLQKTPFSFDVSVWEFFWPLMTGARLVVALPEKHKDNSYLVQTIVQQEITTIHFVPSMLQLFVEEPNISACTSLRRVICSGEALPYDLVERFYSRLDVGLHNLYGPTEAAVDVTYWACRRAVGRRSVPIGRPIANIRLYILDANLQPVPIGVPGELHIGGVGVGRGYHNRPELTQEKFIPDPFVADPTARLYKTGDLARYLSNGDIEYLGRIDYQVKLRGFRIELGEIEAVLADHPQVHETVVLVRNDKATDDPVGAAGKRLTAYLVLNEGATCSLNDLRAYLAKRLPEYMIPTAFVLLPVLPLTPNGKIDRRALPAPDSARPDLENGYAPPRNQVEEQIAELWRDRLGLVQVGIHDSFFSLGGNSLLAIQVISRLRDAFQVDLPLQTIFNQRTIAELAMAIVEKQAEQVDEATLAELFAGLEELPDS
jgi:amino acid adenylation domain-containing protein